MRRLIAVFLLIFGASLVRAADIPAIAAAADLKFALAEVAQAFEKDTGRQLKISYGSSGNFTQQIEQGAPFELFLSADENYIFRLADKGIAVDRGALYAVGRVVLFAPHGSPLKADAQLADLKSALSDGRLKRFAIANPDHAPYGRAARAALQHAGLWETIQPKLVLGENAGQATQFAAAGSSQGGIVPLSLSKAPEIAKLGSFALIPAEWHAAEPLRQRMALTKKAGETARAFHAYVQQPAARAILVRYGFVLPGEQ
jgi:molybdate transport system substrate-binding protein